MVRRGLVKGRIGAAPACRETNRQDCRFARPQVARRVAHRDVRHAARGLGHPRGALLSPGVRRHGAQGEGLAALVRAKRDAVVNGAPQRRRQGVLAFRLERQVAVLGLALQQPLALEVPPDPLAQPLHQRLELGPLGRLHPPEAQPLTLLDVHLPGSPGWARAQGFTAISLSTLYALQDPEDLVRGPGPG